MSSPFADPLRAPEDQVDCVRFQFALDRRAFVQVLGTSLLITVGSSPSADAQSRGGPRGGPSTSISARLQLGADHSITVLTGKVEMGQGARAELSQAAAEELRVPVERIRMVLGDTDLVPDDGLTAGSRTTPSTVPAVRQAAAAARLLLIRTAAARWGVAADGLTVRAGVVAEPGGQRSMAYGDLAGLPEAERALRDGFSREAEVTPTEAWQVLGQSVNRPNLRDLVTGRHRYPSDLRRPGMLFGKVLRPPSFGARLTAIDLSAAQSMPEVVVVRDGDFVGAAASTQARARQAIEAVAATAQWESPAHPSSRDLFDSLRQRARGGVPANPFAGELAKASTVRRATYRTAYVQHAPMETRVALAEWEDGRLSVWTGTQNPFGYRRELARAFRLPEDKVRVVVPDFGGGFGGKHTGEAVVEAARLAQAAKRPVLLQWSREEEFTWACFRPAAVIDAEASLDADGGITTWHFININSGGAALESPYRLGRVDQRFVAADPAPLRHGSYRGLAATANTFARESFMDELAAAAGQDPLAFRLRHLDNPRLRAVLEEAARRFDWARRSARQDPRVGVGLACGTEKGSYVAACVEVEIAADGRQFRVRHLCEVFECGAVLNPDNLIAQMQSGILMGLGPALREEMRFSEGRMRNASFGRYLVPRFADVPELDLHVLPRPDLPSVGGGETPLIPVAPAIANAVYRASGKRIRQMPIRLDAAAPSDDA